jgi:hypothetical protein
MKTITLLFLIFLLSACAPASRPVPTPTATAGPGAVALLSTPQVLPTPLSAGKTASYNDLSIKIEQAEFNERYKTEYGTFRDASPDQKFLWIQFSLETVDKKGVPVPDSDHFSALYGSVEYKPTYGHRDGAPDYSSLGPNLFPGGSHQVWLRFDLPAEADLSDVQFAFLPESTRISSSRSSGTAYYDHPAFLWRLNP